MASRCANRSEKEAGFDKQPSEKDTVIEKWKAEQKEKTTAENRGTEAAYESLYESLASQEAQQKEPLFNRMMYLASFLLVLIFLTAVASLAINLSQLNLSSDHASTESVNPVQCEEIKGKKPSKIKLPNATRPQSNEPDKEAEGIDVNLILNELKREVRSAMINLTTLVRVNSEEMKADNSEEDMNITRLQSVPRELKKRVEEINANVTQKELNAEQKNLIADLTKLVRANSEEIKAENKDLKEALNITRVQLRELKKQVEEMKAGEKTAIANLTTLVRAHSEEMKADNKDLKEALNVTRLHLKELKNRVEEIDVNVLKELKQQKKAIANLTTLVSNKETGPASPNTNDRSRVFKNCAEAYKSASKVNGVYAINPDGLGEFEVFCDQKTAGGGWTVFQKRRDGSVDFFRGWDAYKRGFGNMNGEFWLGLDKIHRLTVSSSNKLRVDLEDFETDTVFAEYNSFLVSDEDTKYKLSLGNFSGTAGDSLKFHNGFPFSTNDNDNDQTNSINCALVNKGGWWYRNCFTSNLNGPYPQDGNITSGPGMAWSFWKNNIYSIKRSETKIRPKDF